MLEDGGSDLARTGLVFDNEDFQVLKTAPSSACDDLTRHRINAFLFGDDFSGQMAIASFHKIAAMSGALQLLPLLR